MYIGVAEATPGSVVQLFTLESLAPMAAVGCSDTQVSCGRIENQIKLQPTDASSSSSALAVGAATSFKASTAHGVTSIEYASWFPKTMEFQAASSFYCTDLAWVILSLGIAIFFGFALLPRTNPAMLFYALVTWGFFYVQIAGQTSNVDYAGMIIDSLGEILVLLAASTWLYRLAPAYTFNEWESRSLKQRVVLWGCCYVLPYHVLLNMTFLAYIPWLNVDLGGYESSTTNGWTYVVFGLIGILAVLCGWHLLQQLYRTMRWKKLMLAYALVLAYVLVSWAMFSSTSFHLHHTMLGAFLLPITRFPTPLAAVAQSVTLGLFVQGYAAWGWTSYLDVKSELSSSVILSQQVTNSNSCVSVAAYLTIHQPAVAPVAANVTATRANVTWEALDSVTGYSLRLNDVEVYHGSDTQTTITGLEPNLTYFLTVAGIADWGTDGQESPTSNFTTLAT